MCLAFYFEVVEVLTWFRVDVRIDDSFPWSVDAKVCCNGTLSVDYSNKVLHFFIRTFDIFDILQVDGDAVCRKVADIINSMISNCHVPVLAYIPPFLIDPNIENDENLRVYLADSNSLLNPFPSPFADNHNICPGRSMDLADLLNKLFQRYLR